MRKQWDLVRYYWNEQTTVLQGITPGEVVLSFAWSAAIPALLDSRIDFKWEQPKEGLIS